MKTRPPVILVTRPKRQAKRLVAELEPLVPSGVTFEISPILKIKPAKVFPDLGGFSGVVLTSENAVRAIAENLSPNGMPAFCVGERTTRAAAEFGFEARQRGATAPELVASLLGNRPGGRLVHLRGEHVRGNLAEALTQGGQPCDDAVVYRQIPQELSLSAQKILKKNPVVILPIFSPRTALLLSEAVRGAKAQLALICISGAALKSWSGPHPVYTAVAKTPDGSAMLRALLGGIDAVQRLEGQPRPS